MMNCLMTRQRNKIYAQGNALIRKFYMCTENVKIALFKSLGVRSLANASRARQFNPPGVG